jgi:photosynthetic reaction center cytochrome c subunit
MSHRNRAFAIAAAVAASALLAACEPPPVESVQRGFRGTAMGELYRPAAVARSVALNTLPPAAATASPDGPRASQVFKNVKVLGDLSVGQFTQLMIDITAWVAPQQGCNYCHNPTDLSDDAVYTKVVSRRMLQMTQHINADWKPHVADTGVTCFTCHRGNNVPANVWYRAAEPTKTRGVLGNRAGQNAPAMQVGLTSLPNDPFSTYLGTTDEIRVVSTSALPQGTHPSMIQQTEATYGLMIHMSKALGVNCTYCHNTRSFASWEMSTPQRTTAYYGIRLVRDLDANYLTPLASVLPANRLGPTGDAPKVDCATCHQGAYKPLFGAKILNGRLGLSAVSATMTSGTPATEQTADGAIFYFAVGSAAVAGDAASGVAALAEKMKASPAARVTISGFHSASGQSDQNQELSKQRAFAVRDALKAAGIAEERVVLVKPQQVEGNVSGEDPKARRVEVAVK